MCSDFVQGAGDEGEAHGFAAYSRDGWVDEAHGEAEEGSAGVGGMEVENDEDGEQQRRCGEEKRARGTKSGVSEPGSAEAAGEETDYCEYSGKRSEEAALTESDACEGSVAAHKRDVGSEETEGVAVDVSGDERERYDLCARSADG